MVNLDILYEDSHIIVVIKPQNVPSQADESGDVDMLTMVKQYIKEKYNKLGNAYVGLVHRLDRPTGGIMVFAKTSKSAKKTGWKTSSPPPTSQCSIFSPASSRKSSPAAAFSARRRISGTPWKSLCG